MKRSSRQRKVGARQVRGRGHRRSQALGSPEVEAGFVNAEPIASEKSALLTTLGLPPLELLARSLLQDLGRALLLFRRCYFRILDDLRVHDKLETAADHPRAPGEGVASSRTWRRLPGDCRFPACFLVIFLLLMTHSARLAMPCWYFSALPLASTGGVLALWLRGIPFSVSAALGLHRPMRHAFRNC
jgi:AcrB/AcrD/AcrF family